MASLPLTLNPEESFQIVIFNVLYNMRQLWNTAGEYWILDIRDADGNALALGVKLVTGIFLLSQYPGIRFDLKSDSLLADPTRDDLTDFVFEITNKDV